MGSGAAQAQQQPLIVVTRAAGVTTLRMNRPKRFNGWTMPMMQALREHMAAAADDVATKVVILTGTGRYYCAGVNLGGSFQVGHPRTLHAGIIEHNERLFRLFLDFPKPLLIAVNGPAIGAAVTSATLSDGIIAADSATFSTPFAALGITPEGCSSVLFERMMGAKAAQRMLGAEGWQPTAAQAREAGLIEWVAPDDELMQRATEIAAGWIEQGKQRRYRGATLDELRAVNARESIGVADSFLGAPFMRAQFKFLWSKNKRKPALMFLGLLATRPLWSRLLPR